MKFLASLFFLLLCSAANAQSIDASGINNPSGSSGSTSSGLVIGTTTISGGTNTDIEYNNNGVLGEYSVTGTGTTAVLSTSPVFTTGITDPLVIGGTATNATLTLESTSGVGSGDSLIFKTGSQVTQMTIGTQTIAASLPITTTGTIGLGTTTTTNAINITGQSAQTVNMVRETTASTAGNNLTIQAGGGTPLGTNLNGGNLTLASGISTGNGSSSMNFNVYKAGSSGTADTSATTAMTIASNGFVDIGTPSSSSTFEVYSGVSANAAPSTAQFINTVDQPESLVFAALTPNLTTTHAAYFIVGPSNTTNNAGQFAFFYQGGAGSGSNFLQLALEGHVFGLNVFSSSVGLGTSATGANAVLGVNGGATFGTYGATGVAAPSNGLIVSGNVGIGSSVPTTNLDVGGPIKTLGYTVATLPAGVVGMRAYVTDQLTACVVAGAALTGGGAVTCPVFYNGTAWVGD